MEASQNGIENFLEREIIYEYNSLGLITKSFLEEETFCKDEPWVFLTMIEEMFTSKGTWDPTYQSIIKGNDLLINDIDDYFLSKYLKGNSKVIMKEEDGVCLMKESLEYYLMEITSIKCLS